MPLPEISAAIRVFPAIPLEQSIGDAFERELTHVMSGRSDHEDGELETPSDELDSDASESEPLPLARETVPSTPSRSEGLPTKRSSCKTEADRRRRKFNRKLRKAQNPSVPRHSNSKKHPEVNPISVDFDAHDLPAAKGAFVSRRQQCDTSHECTLEELIDRGFNVVEWDGRTPTAVVDQEDRVITILAGRPEGSDWDVVQRQMSTLLEEAPHKVLGRRGKERRGSYVLLSTGISYGGGQTAPGNLIHKDTNKELIDKLRKSVGFIRAAGFMSSCFALYAPKLCKDYEINTNALLTKYPRLKKPFTNSVFPTCTFNCGPRVVTLEHVDSTNVPYGLCAVFACGSYDPTKGGHLILFNLGLVVQFPPGSTILIPSGTIRHGNVAIQSHETRQSFTQYCPGGLLRWVAYGFQSVKVASQSIKQEFVRTQEERRERAVGLFSKASEVYSDRVAVFNLKSYR